jgi:hypothetical protein
MPHFHGDAVNVLFVGVKLWVLVAPPSAAFVDAHASSWFKDSYLPAALSRGRAPVEQAEGAVGGVHYILLQGPGDLVFVPQQWGHAVLNLADTYALAYE